MASIDSKNNNKVPSNGVIRDGVGNSGHFLLSLIKSSVWVFPPYLSYKSFLSLIKFVWPPVNLCFFYFAHNVHTIGNFLQHALLSSRRDVSCCELPIPILKRLTEVNLKDEADWVTFFFLPIQTSELPPWWGKSGHHFEASYNDKYIYLVLKNTLVWN